jgi:hypothetical protein
VRLYLEWCERNEHPVELTRVQIQQYAAELDVQPLKNGVVAVRPARA